MVKDTMTDFALAAYVDEGRWDVLPLPPHAFESLDALVATLRGLPGQSGALALVSLGDEVFVIVRVVGRSVRVLLSDGTAEREWPLAADIMETLGLPGDDDVEPVGDRALLSDLGVSPMEMTALCDDLELYPDDVFASLARRLGFRGEFEETLDTVLR